MLVVLNTTIYYISVDYIRNRIFGSIKHTGNQTCFFNRINSMHRSENTILIWVLTWAGLLLALLYSPIGSPDLYRHRNYFTENQGVNFNGSGISRGSGISFLKILKNAPRNISGNQNEDTELNVPTANNNPTKRYNYQVSGGSKSFIQTKAVLSVGNNHIVSSNSLIGNNGSGSNAGNTGGGSSLCGGNSSNTGLQKSAQFNSGFHNPGVASTSIDLSVFGDSTVNQTSRNTQKVDSLVDPGDSALDEPIPVPEGWSFLILSALIYCGYILLKKKQVELK